MKLLYCKKCNDIVKIQRNWRTCHCGNSKAKYVGNRKVEYSGFGVILGICNDSMKRALLYHEAFGLYHNINAFVIDRSSEWIKKVDEHG